MAQAPGAAPDGSINSDFADPIKGYDVHVYFFHTNPKSVESAAKLRETIIEKFPHLAMYRLWDRPVGPHGTAMFEVDLKTPAEFGEFVPWINVNRGEHSVLVHPKTGNDLRDHTVHALWIGQPVILDKSVLVKGER